MRRPLTQWAAFATGWQRTLRKPYRDAEVRPVAGGWHWKVCELGGSVEVHGICPTRLEAMAAATTHMLDVAFDRRTEVVP